MRFTQHSNILMRYLDHYQVFTRIRSSAMARLNYDNIAMQTLNVKLLNSETLAEACIDHKSSYGILNQFQSVFGRLLYEALGEYGLI